MNRQVAVSDCSALFSRMDFAMAWRNIWRNRRRSLLTISAIAFAVALLVFMLSFQFGTYETMISSAVKVHTGFFQVQAKKYREKQEIHYTVPDPEAIGRILDSIGAVTACTFRAESFSLASSEERTYGVMVTGIDPRRETGVSTIGKLIRQGEFLSPGDENQALIGEILAKNLRVGLGDPLTVLGQGREGSVAATVLAVKGIFKSGQDEFDRNALYIPLSYFQEVYEMGSSVHRVVGLTRFQEDVPAVKESIRKALQTADADHSLAVLDWKELMPGLVQSIKLDLSFGIIFYIFLIIVVAFSILNTFLMAIFERTREFGVLMALGTTRGRLTRLLLTESLCMTLIGIVSGMILGVMITLWYQSRGIDFGEASELLAQYGIPGIMYPKLTLLSASIGPMLVFFITFWAALWPALKVRKLKPVEAMNYS
ncbi:MAG: FtsX-like permease family protein [Desulfobacterales bacterium]